MPMTTTTEPDQPLEPQPSRTTRYLLWSGKHNAWWRTGGSGYTTDRDEAGRFNWAEAIERVSRSAYHGDPELVTRMVWTDV